MAMIPTRLVVKSVIGLTLSFCPVQKMKSEVSSSSSRSRLHASQRGALLGPSYEGPKQGGGRYAKMEREMQRSNTDFIRNEVQDQQVCVGHIGWELCVACSICVYHI